MVAQRIPVTLGNDDTKIIGAGEIDERGDLVIKIKASALIKDLDHMVSLMQIRKLALGVGYEKAREARYFCPRCDNDYPTMLEMEDHRTRAHPNYDG